METISNNQIIENYLLEFPNNSLKDAIAKIAKDRVLDLKVIRDRSICESYIKSRRETDKKIREIDDDLAYIYDMSVTTISLIVRSG